MTISKVFFLLPGGLLAITLAGCDVADTSTPSASALPPRYLEIDQFQHCLSRQNAGTYEQWCLPAAKPDNCPAESWNQLRHLQGNDKLLTC